MPVLGAQPITAVALGSQRGLGVAGGGLLLLPPHLLHLLLVEHGLLPLVGEVEGILVEALTGVRIQFPEEVSGRVRVAAEDSGPTCRGPGR
jgi:hypothetical protein